MHSSRLLRLIPALLPILGFAADPATAPIATWTAGDGTIGGATATANAAIVPDAPLASGAKTPAEFSLAAIPTSKITLGPGTALSLHQDDGNVLVIALTQGDVQVDVQGQKAYTAIIVRGEAADVKITGTLFVVERVRHDENYVAMVEGKCHITLRRQLANGLFDPDAPSVDLIAHQGVDASKENGLGAIETLNNRPQISSADHDSIRTQGLADEVGDGGWGHDDAGNLLANLATTPPVNQGTPDQNTHTPDLNNPTINPAAPETTTPELNVLETANVTTEIINDILDNNTIQNFGGGTGNTSEIVHNSTVGAPVHPPVLGNYPGPPGP
jgi:hypothetical protein